MSKKPAILQVFFRLRHFEIHIIKQIKYFGTNNCLIECGLPKGLPVYSSALRDNSAAHDSCAEVSPKKASTRLGKTKKSQKNGALGAILIPAE